MFKLLTERVSLHSEAAEVNRADQRPLQRAAALVQGAALRRDGERELGDAVLLPHGRPRRPRVLDFQQVLEVCGENVRR